MILFTKEIREQLRRNGKKTHSNPARDLGHEPVVKIFDPVGSATWLISEMDPHDADLLFGLGDLGMGFPEMGYVSLGELETFRTTPFGLPLERDLYWSADGTLTEYATAARNAGRIVDSTKEVAR